MVIEDFSSEKSLAEIAIAKKSFKIAAVLDRTLAFVFDIVIFTPVFGFILAKIFKQLHRVYFLSPDSSEFSVLLLITILFAAMLAILFQTACLLLWGATPGKIFFKLKVVPLNPVDKNSPQRISFSQALLRSTVWCLEVFCLCLPWFEVLSQTHRRPLHDRAAETMVVTHKQEGDKGPHWLEAQFVRQFLLATFLVFFVYALFSLGHYYKMAAQGDFRRAEMDANESLCPEVASQLQEGELRIDKALALYLAGQVSEDCLSAEAGFVMWAPENEDKPWAYLAQGFLMSYDPESQKDYFQKVCEFNQSEACALANYKTKKGHLVGDSLSAQVLRAEQGFESGNYQQAEQVFQDLSKVSGFESYVQEGFIKNFWSRNQPLQAQGAYQTIVHELDFQHAQALSAWMCHEELDQNCSSDAQPACEDLKEDYIANEQLPLHDSYVALALLREKECRHSNDISLSRFHELFEERQDVYDYARAISQQTPLSSTDRKNLLMQLAFRRESVRPSLIRNLAMQGLIEKSQSEKDLSPVVDFLKHRKVKDFLWVKLFKKTLLKLNAMSATPMVAELVGLPEPAQIATYHLEGLLSQSKGLIAKTHFTAPKTDHSEGQRLPASTESR